MNIALFLKEEITLHEQIKGRLKEKDVNNPVIEFKVGDDWYRKSGEWCLRELYINRKENHYREIVKEKATGKLIHKCGELLSKHIGHGDAKHKEGLKW